MKKTFSEFYKLSEKELELLWKNCLFVFDTSVLINLYEFSPKVRDEFLEVLKKNTDRIWVPHQVAQEFQWRRPSVIREQRKIHQLLKENFHTYQEKIIVDIEKSIEYHPFIDKNLLATEVKSKFSELIAYLKKCESDYPDLIKKDIVGEKIEALFENKVGGEFSDDERDKTYNDGFKRYAQKIPPGFADKDSKDNLKQYGDLLIWYQIINESKASNKPVIFVTNDQKSDWWFVYIQEKPFEKEILGPRPELIKEFYTKTKNQFYMYTPSNFLEASRKYLKQKVSDGAIKEVKDISKRRSVSTWGTNLIGTVSLSEALSGQSVLQPRETISEYVKRAQYEPIGLNGVLLRSTDASGNIQRVDDTGIRSVIDTQYESGSSPGSIFFRSTDNPNSIRVSELFQHGFEGTQFESGSLPNSIFIRSTEKSDKKHIDDPLSTIQQKKNKR